MKILSLRRSSLALCVAASIHVPGAVAANLTYDLGSGVLNSTGQTFDFVTLTGTLNSVGSNPQPMASAAFLSNLRVNGEFTNNASITLSSLHSGTGIYVSSAPSSSALFQSNFINNGSISVSGAADAGEVTGVEILSTSLGGNFINAGTVSANGLNASAVLLGNTTFGKGVVNSGNLIASGTDSVGLLLDHATLQMPVSNTGVIRATGANAEALTLEGVTFNPPPGASTGGIFNSGTLSGESIGVHVSEQPTNQGALSIYQVSGSIEGGTAAIQVDDGASYLYWEGGDVKGNLMGLTGVMVSGDVSFDGSTIKARYVDIGEGQLTLVRAHTTIIGDLDMDSPHAVLAMSLGNDTNPALPVLNVTGTTDILPGGRVQLEARSSDFRPAGTPYTLIRSGTLIGGENLTVASSSALLEVASYGVEGNDVKALIRGKGEATVTQDILSAGGSSNAARAASSFSPSVMGALDEQDPVFRSFATAGSAAELARLSEQLSPDVSRAIIHATTNSQTLVSNVIQARSSSARTGLSSGDALAGQGVWLQALSSDADQGARKGVDGYDANSHGIAVGADGKLNADTTLGLAYSYLNSDVKSDIGSKTDVTGHALTLYGDWTHDNFFVDASLMYGWNDNESKRYIAGTRAKGDYDSEIFGVNALAGYSLRLDRQLLLEPQVGARYANVAIDSYREKGSSAALNVGSQRYEIGEMGIGARLAAVFDAGPGSLEPEAKVMAWHDFIGDKASTTSTFVLGDTPFTTRGAAPARDSYELGLGATYRVGAWSLGGSYNYLTRADFNADTFTAKVRYDF